MRVDVGARRPADVRLFRLSTDCLRSMSRPFLGCVLSLITPSGDQSLTSAHCKARSRIGNLHYLRTELAIERGVPNGVQSIRPLIIICKVPCSTDGGDAGSA